VTGRFFKLWLDHPRIVTRRAAWRCTVKIALKWAGIDIRQPNGLRNLRGNRGSSPSGLALSALPGDSAPVGNRYRNKSQHRHCETDTGAGEKPKKRITAHIKSRKKPVIALARRPRLAQPMRNSFIRRRLRGAVPASRAKAYRATAGLWLSAARTHAQLAALARCDIWS
jgi:hypothetical protein